MSECVHKAARREAERVQRLTDFVASLSRMTKDQECPRDAAHEGEDMAGDCAVCGSPVLDMESDDAVEALHCAIDTARRIMRGES